MICQPIGKLRSFHQTLCDSKDNHLCIIHISGEFQSIENHHHFNHGVANSLVAINERMILNQRETQAGDFLEKRG